jgi:hypothetical protein
VPALSPQQRRLLPQILDHAFWIGFYTALLIVILIAVAHGFLVGQWGPIKKAMESPDGTQTIAGGEMQPDEQPI